MAFFKNLSKAFRNIPAKGQHNLVKILCLSLGLATSSVLIAEVFFEQSFDSFFPDFERTYAINEVIGQDGKINDYPFTPGAVAPGLKQYAPQVEAATRITQTFNDQQCILDDKKTFSANIDIADSCLFDVLPRKIIQGDPKEALSRPYYCMIAASLAKQIGGEVMGKHFVIAGLPGYDLVIKGVFEDFPRNSTLYGLDIFLSSRTYDLMQPGSTTNWVGNDRYSSYIRLTEGARPEDLKNAVNRMVEDHFPAKLQKQYGVSQSYSFTAISDVYKSNPQVKKMAWILSLLAFVLLFSALMNYLLIVVGNMVTRSREMAIRKCYGAGRKTIGGIIFSEALAHLILSILLAAIILYCCKGTIENMISAPISVILFNKGSWILLILCVIVLVLGGIVPGIMYSSIPVASSFRGFKETRRRWKLALLSVQFIAAGFLFSLLLVVSKQYDHMVNANLGYDYSNLAVLTVDGANMSDNERCINELKHLPQVKDISCSWELPIHGQSGNNVRIPGDDRDLFNIADLYYTYDDYFKVMGIEIIQGTGFTNGLDSLSEVMVSESFVKKMETVAKWGPDIVGKQVMISEHSGLNNKRLTICGVYKDIVLGSFNNLDERPSVMFYYSHPAGSFIMIKFHNMDDKSIKLIYDKSKALFPDKQLTVSSYSTLVMNEYASQKSFRTGVLIAGCVILIISLFGLVGYVSDEVQRRRKEIAIRKVNGAVERDIFSLFFKSMIQIAVPSLLVGVIAAWVVSEKWLMLFSSKITLNPLYFFAVLLVLLLVILGAVAINCSRIATSNPVDYLKDE